MFSNESAFNQIGISLAKHFDSLYYVEIQTGNFKEIVYSPMLSKLSIPKEGDDFFSFARSNAHKCVHPDDLDTVLNIHSKDTILKNLLNNKSYSTCCRLIIEGTVVHVRHVMILCEDKEHVLCCMENIDEEIKEKAEQKRNLDSAERMARRDELTGIKNKNAFTEYCQAIDEKINSGMSYSFGIVMCDLNNLKLLNDTRGHNFGDEAIQRASRMICNIYKHSPVFRIGGDEFVAILSGDDYENRDELLQKLRDETKENVRSRSGPEVACGMAVYDSENDKNFSHVFEKADLDMYDNKKELKSRKLMEGFRKMDDIDKVIPAERKRILDSLFGALITVAGGGYVYLNDMRYDYSRWSLSLIDDFNLQAEYMYHADRIWHDYIHPEDLKAYEDAVDAVLCGNAELRHINYRARKADGTYVVLATRGFVLNDSNGNPEYFGGIIIPQ